MGPDAGGVQGFPSVPLWPLQGAQAGFLFFLPLLWPLQELKQVFFLCVIFYIHFSKLPRIEVDVLGEVFFFLYVGAARVATQKRR